MLAERRRKEPGPFLEGSVRVQPHGMAVTAQLYGVPCIPGACAQGDKDAVTSYRKFKQLFFSVKHL